MNVSSFLANHGLASNPFAAEEARQDEVFSRIEDASRHPDFEKIRGDLDRPASSVVFGERGAGKTAIRMQLERALLQHNAGSANGRCLGVTYDDFNAILGPFNSHVATRGDTHLAVLQRIRLADHMDAILSLAVPAVVDALLGARRDEPHPPARVVLNDEPARAVKAMDREARRDLLILQACYDRPADAALRAEQLRRLLRLRSRDALAFLGWGAGIAAVAALGILLWSIIAPPEGRLWAWNTAFGALLFVAILLGGRLGLLWFQADRLARRMARSIRVINRPASSYRRVLRALGPATTLETVVPQADDDETRFAMTRRLLEALRPLGYGSVLVIIDRLDEPTMVAGDVDHMQALVWPFFNSKLLQQDSIGLKLLLPIEIRHLVGRESGSFFREARLDKQNVVERLAWSGATLYDLCTARLNACRLPGRDPVSLMNLFDEGVREQDVVDALDQLQQPRDAFKFLYHLVQEHCSTVTEENPQWRIPRPLFDAVRKRQVERMQEMLKGIRPA